MKTHSQYVCQQCNYKSSSYLGKCPECGTWNSLVETITSNQQPATSNLELIKPVKLAEVKGQEYLRMHSGFSEFDRVLGSGIVPGSIVLIAGDPGIGKSTLLLQTAIRISEGKVGQSSAPSEPARPLVLYVTGEESPQQVKLRADRLGKTPTSLFILPQTDADVIVGVAEKLKPTLVIVDSIQTLTTDKLTGLAGSVGQVRECAHILQRFAKNNQIPVFLVGHVTKEGNVAGPKVLEHLVDAVLNLEGDNMHAFRLLRSIKNRFGSTFEVGVFEMTDQGMVEVSNPSKIFLAERINERPGSVVCATLAGGRPILAEVQALVTSTMFGIPARKITGLDFGRIQIVIAALSRAAKLALSNMDIYVNVAGGLKITEPAGDLAAALAIASAVSNRPINVRTCAFGEVGLLGELRPVGNIKSRINEAKRLGFADFVTSEKFKTLEQAISYAIK